MKKLFIVSILFLAITTASAQDFRIGLKGIFNSTWLFNNNISDYGDEIDYMATFGFNTGLTSAMYFTENLGVSLDVFYTQHSQILIGSTAASSYTSSNVLKYLDMPVLFRVSSEGGPYVEIGPQVSFLLNATETYTGSAITYTQDYKEDFNSTQMAGILGFGYDIPAGDNLQINVGLRFGYGVSDVTKKFSESEAELFPLNGVKTGSGDHSSYSQAAHTSAIVPHVYSYQKTGRAFGGLSLGVIYRP